MCLNDPVSLSASKELRTCSVAARFRRGSGAPKELSFRAADLAELHRAPSILVQSWCARRGALLLLCKATIRRLIESGDETAPFSLTFMRMPGDAPF